MVMMIFTSVFLYHGTSCFVDVVEAVVESGSLDRSMTQDDDDGSPGVEGCRFERALCIGWWSKHQVEWGSSKSIIACIIVL